MTTRVWGMLFLLKSLIHLKDTTLAPPRLPPEGGKRIKRHRAVPASLGRFIPVSPDLKIPAAGNSPWDFHPFHRHFRTIQDKIAAKEGHGSIVDIIVAAMTKTR